LLPGGGGDGGGNGGGDGGDGGGGQLRALQFSDDSLSVGVESIVKVHRLNLLSFFSQPVIL
jgi:hypothetical protein